MTAIRKKELVVKSNRIIEASYRLTLNEQRIILYSISRAREEQKGLFPNLPITITAELFARQFIAINKERVYSQLREAMDALYDRSVTYHDTDPETSLPRVKTTRWLSEKAYIDGAGRIQVIFAPSVIEHIARLESEFTSYQLDKVGNMTSAHAIRIYELLAQYREIGSRELELKWLRESLQFDPSEYKLTSNLRDKVLDVAVEQINKHSDLLVSYKPKKTGRSITSFVFKIKSKDALAPKKRSPMGPDQAERDALERRGQQRIEHLEMGHP